MVNDERLRDRLSQVARERVKRYTWTKRVEAIVTAVEDRGRSMLSFVVNSTSGGGAETQLLNLASHLRHETLFSLEPLPDHPPDDVRARSLATDSYRPSMYGNLRVFVRGVRVLQLSLHVTREPDPYLFPKRPGGQPGPWSHSPPPRCENTQPPAA